MNVLGIIPARQGSKRLPRKNVRLLGEKPLVAWTIEAALETSSLDRIIVSSDDDEVLAIAASYGSTLAFRRPAHLATDRSPAIDYVQQALEVVEDQEEEMHYDAIVILQPSSPLTEAADVDATVTLLRTSGADTAVSVMHLDHAIHPVKLKVMKEDRLLPYLEEERGRMASHELPTLYVRNCAIYATRRHIVEQGQIIGADCRGYVMPRERSVDINEEIDLRFADFLLAQRNDEKLTL